MVTVLITLAIMIGLPLLFIILIGLGQRLSYRNNKKVNETYKQFCERYYVRYV